MLHFWGRGVLSKVLSILLMGLGLHLRNLWNYFVVGVTHGLPGGTFMARGYLPYFLGSKGTFGVSLCIFGWSMCTNIALIT